MDGTRCYNGEWAGENLNRVAFPLGGIGAGMVCLDGTGDLSHVSVRNRPDVFNEPLVFGALAVKGDPVVARVLSGPVPGWKVLFPWAHEFGPAGNGSGGKNYGLPHFRSARFQARFPFATVELQDPKVPLEVSVRGWSPFLPGDADNSSLPVGCLEYRFENRSERPVESVFSFHAANFMRTNTGGDSVRMLGTGFALCQPGTDEAPWHEGAFGVVCDDPQAVVNCRWYRAGWFDPLTMVWKSVNEAAVVAEDPVTSGRPSPGGSVYVPFKLHPGESRTVRVRLSWYVPASEIRLGYEAPEPGTETGGVPEAGSCCCGSPGDTGPARETYRPWYAGRFRSLDDVEDYWRTRADWLEAESAVFADCFQDTTLPPEVVEAVGANLTILKSPTVLRQVDGRLWGWEGCCDVNGCCAGSCTHVWNYAQALPHLFPDLERSLRETEFFVNQDERGHCRSVLRTTASTRPPTASSGG
jgi:hypothetical protein